jgi:hypothetical protein
MNWQQIRVTHPHQWVLIEATKAHSRAGERVLDELALLGIFADSQEAMRDYQKLHHESPQRELYVLHTDRDEPNIGERHWIGVRGR